MGSQDHNDFRSSRIEQPQTQREHNIESDGIIAALEVRIKALEKKNAEYEAERKDAVKWAIGTLLMAVGGLAATIIHFIFPGLPK